MQAKIEYINLVGYTEADAKRIKSIFPDADIEASEKDKNEIKSVYVDGELPLSEIQTRQLYIVELGIAALLENNMNNNKGLTLWN